MPEFAWQVETELLVEEGMSATMKSTFEVGEGAAGQAQPGSPTSHNADPRTRYGILIALASLVSVIWAIRAFSVRGSLLSAALVAAGTLLLCGLVVGLTLYVDRSRPTETVSCLRRLAWAAASPTVLFSVYLPEYLLGGAVSRWRSVILGALTVALAAFLFRVATRREVSSPALEDEQLSLGARVAFWGGLAGYFIVITALSLRKLATLGYAGQDLAYFSQIFYTTLHGKLFYSNFYQDLLYTRTVQSDFAGHNSPIQFIFVAFYRFFPRPATNLVVRNLFMTLSAAPAYLLARTRFRPKVSVVLALMFLCVPAIFFQNLFEFYPFSLAAFFLLTSFWLFASGRLRPFLVSLLLLLAVREDLVFAVFAFGLLALWMRRSRTWVIVPLALSVFWAVLSWKVVLPHFLEGAPYRSNVCFAHLGNNGPQMLRTIVHHPTTTILTRDNLIYLKQMMMPFGGVLPWLSPAALGAVPYLTINLLGGAGECPTTAIFSQHSVVPTVFLFVGFLWSLNWLSGRVGRYGVSSRQAVAATVAFAFALTLADFAFALYPEQFHELRQNPVVAEVHQMAALVPSDAPVAVPRYMAPLFANRMSLYMTDDLLDYHHPDPQYVIVDRSFARMRRSPKWHGMYDSVNAALAKRPDMQVVYESANFLMYRRENVSPALQDGHSSLPAAPDGH